VIAAAVLPADRDSFSLPALWHYCRSELAPHMIPARIVPVAKLPRTPTGKADRAALRAFLAAAGADYRQGPGR